MYVKRLLCKSTILLCAVFPDSIPFLWILHLFLCGDHILHIVIARLFACQELARLYSAFTENSLGICRMLEGDNLVCTGKDHLMLADDRTAAHSTDTDLLIITLLSHLASVINHMILVIQSLVHAVGQGDGCTARCIQFQAVMLLNDLHIKACRGKHLCGIL